MVVISRNDKENHFGTKITLQNCSNVKKLQLKPVQNQINSRELAYCPERQRKLFQNHLNVVNCSIIQ